MLTNPFVIKKVGEILGKTILGGDGEPDTVLEKIKDVMGQPDEPISEEPEEVRAVKGEYEDPELDDWEEDDDDDKAEKEAGKHAWHALKKAHHREWETLKRRHEDEREALKREHEDERGELKRRVKGAYETRGERRGSGFKDKHKGRGKGQHKNKGRGRGRGPGPR